MSRIALIIPTLDRSGAEKQLSLLAGGLRQHGHEPRVFALDRGGYYEERLREHDIDVLVMGKRSKFDVSAIRRLRSELADFQPDVLHTWLFAGHAYGYAAGRSLNVPWVQSLRCVDSWKSGWQRWVDRRLWSRVAKFVANSESVKDWYEKQGIQATNVKVIPNGVEAPNRIDDRAAICAEANIPLDAEIIVSVGRLAKQKRMRDLLWAMQLMKQSSPSAYMLVVGDGPERAALVEYARDVESLERIRFVGHSDDPSRYYCAADAFWLASDFEGQSNSLQEAMSYGVPVVVSDIAPNRELVKHGDTGYLAGVGDSAAYAQLTIRLFDQPDLAKQLGDAGRERMICKHSVNSMVKAYAGLYDELTAGQPQEN